MITQDILKSITTYKSTYAYLNLNNNSFYIKNNPKLINPSNQYISLKDVEYTIFEGVLYISGSKISFYKLDDLAWRYEFFSSNRIIYPISQKKLDLLINPPILKDVIIKRWWMNNKVIKAVELSDKNESDIWYQTKEIIPFEIAISNFQLIEKY